MSAGRLSPVPEDLVARLRAAAAAGSPGEAQTWVFSGARATGLLTLLFRAVSLTGWYRHA
jgi:hypothetical protein